MEKLFLHLQCVGWVEYSPSPKGRNPLQQKNRRKSKALRHVLGKRPSSPSTCTGYFHYPRRKSLTAATYCTSNRTLAAFPQIPTGRRQQNVLAGGAPEPLLRDRMG